MSVNKDHSHLALIVDRSGSMAGKEGDVIGGVNQFLADQKQTPGTADITITKFDNLISHETRPLHDVQAWGAKDYVVGASTALLDAIGETMNEIGRRIQTTQPGAVVVVIITDGMENASVKYKKADIKAMIEHAQGKGWVFIYLGANVDAFSEATAMGITMNTASNMSNTAAGVTAAYSTASATAGATRAWSSVHGSSIGAGVTFNVPAEQKKNEDLQNSSKPA